MSDYQFTIFMSLGVLVFVILAVHFIGLAVTKSAEKNYKAKHPDEETDGGA